MDAYRINQTKTTPFISFDPVTGFFQIKGESRPENVRTFFEPILLWIEEFYLKVQKEGNKDIKPITLTIQLGYFNSSSAKFIFDFILKMKHIKELGLSVKIIWIYDEGDEDMKLAGMDLAEMIEIEFEFQELKGK